MAEWKGTEAAVCFPTGFAANLGVLCTLGGPGVRVLSDELNHASIIDGCRLSRSALAVYRHRDMAHLEELLADAGEPARTHATPLPDADHRRHRLRRSPWMGTSPPSTTWSALCRRHDALLDPR